MKFLKIKNDFINIKHIKAIKTKEVSNSFARCHDRSLEHIVKISSEIFTLDGDKFEVPEQPAERVIEMIGILLSIDNNQCIYLEIDPECPDYYVLDSNKNHIMTFEPYSDTLQEG